MYGIGGKHVEIDEATRRKIIVLYRDHLLTQSELRSRFPGIPVPNMRKVLVEANVEIRGKRSRSLA